MPAETAPLDLLDFYASWCVQCSLQRDCLERLAGEYPGRLHIDRVDIDAMPDTARRYGVHDVPTLVLQRGGRMLERVTGAQPCEKLAALLAFYLTSQTQEGN